MNECRELMERQRKERGHEEARRKSGGSQVETSVCVCVWPDGSSVWRPARGTGAGHMTSRYHGDGDCSWREDERRRAPGTERGRETRGRGERVRVSERRRQNGVAPARGGHKHDSAEPVCVSSLFG